jgi:D-serine deaminase-like pyridoxal phosphate-dependent protein
MERKIYELKDTSDLISPALIYYKDIILENTKRIIEMSGTAENLWPHMKSHKVSEMILMQIGLGINRFKCATIAEAEMTAEAGGKHIILAYPLIGPNIPRYLRLATAYPQTVFYAIGDDYQSLCALAAKADEAGMNMNVLIDVDMGMNRTGVPIEALELLYERSSVLKGISLKGLHCYDGHRTDQDFDQRKAKAEETDAAILKIQETLKGKGFECEIMVMGGTPSFPCRTGKSGFYLSPGTVFIGDWGYYNKFPDMAFTPGAAVFCRVVSHQAGNSFTVDVGSKGIAADPVGDRGVIVGLEEAASLFQSEEHWVFSLPENMQRPSIGSGQYIIPTHICPTSALYPAVEVAQNGNIVEQWQVAARRRVLKY